MSELGQLTLNPFVVQPWFSLAIRSISVHTGLFALGAEYRSRWSCDGVVQAQIVALTVAVTP